MNKKHIAAIATVVVLVAAAAAVVLYMGEDQYTITYELNGGDNNSLNPTSYTSGDEIQLYDAYDDERVFVAWYLDEGLTQECDTIQSDMSGDITLYAGWSDTVVGKGLTFDVQGSYTSGLLSSYSMDGSVSYEYLYMNEDGDYLIGTDTEMTYTFLGMSRQTSSSDRYWSGDSDIQWSSQGTETIDTINGEKLCEVILGTHSDGSTETQWIADGWITYKIEYTSIGVYSSTTYTYTLTDVYNVETDFEIDLTVYSDLGIDVSGGGTYSPGDTATLTAEVDSDTVFAGWFDSDGNLLSTNRTITLELEYGDVTVYALNSTDPDIETVTGSSFDVEYTDTTEWTVTDSDGDVVAEFWGDPSSHSFDNAGIYTITSVDADNGVYMYFTVFVDGYSTLEYEWTVNGEDYSYTLQILYSDVQYYRDYYSVSERQQDIYGNHARDRTFVTYEDKYIQKIAADFADMTSGMSELEGANFILAFSQCLGYEDDQMYMGTEEYWKFPLETLYDHGGDCEDTSILLAAIAKAMGYDTSLLLFPGHMATGMAVDGATGTYFATNSSARYFYCETTATGYSVGELPQSMQGYTATMVVIY